MPWGWGAQDCLSQGQTGRDGTVVTDPVSGCPEPLPGPPRPPHSAASAEQAGWDLQALPGLSSFMACPSYLFRSPLLPDAPAHSHFPSSRCTTSHRNGESVGSPFLLQNGAVSGRVCSHLSKAPINVSRIQLLSVMGWVSVPARLPRKESRSCSAPRNICERRRVFQDCSPA